MAPRAEGAGLIWGCSSGGGWRRGKRRGERSRVVATGFYEDRLAPLTALDFVMSPTGRGCCNEHPLHPRVPGGLRLPWTPKFILHRIPSPGSFPAALRASGDLPGGMRMCTMLPQHGKAKVPLRHVSCAASLRRQLPSGVVRLRVIWRRECDVRMALGVVAKRGAFTFALLAAHIPPSKPPSIRGQARNVVVAHDTGKYSRMFRFVDLAKETFVRRYAAAAGDRRRGFARRKLRRSGCAPQ
jgi:hypothetical protein